ncbi:MAG: tyrosine-type recombinase/integrase [Clostridia bacterium]|nr:tyrosine-type recombinase/integrase [Clostridia bacterium]
MGKDLKGKEIGLGLRQRPDGRYEARAVVKGEQICLYNMNLQKLKKDFKEAKDAIMLNLDKQAKLITLSEWFNQWFETYKKPYLKESSAIVMYSKFNNVFCKRLGYTKLYEINNMMIQSIVNDEVKNGRVASNIREVTGVLKNCLESAKNNRLLSINPAFEAGMHPKVVQALMGHSDYSTTMNIYTHVSEMMLKNESQKIKSLFDESSFTQQEYFLPNFNFM